MADIVKNANVGMAQRRDGARFAIETLFGFGALREMLRQDFYRDEAIEPRVQRTIYFAHAARAQRRLDFVWSEFRPRRQHLMACMLLVVRLDFVQPIAQLRAPNVYRSA